MNNFVTAVPVTSRANGEIGKLAKLKILFPKGIEGSSHSLPISIGLKTLHSQGFEGSNPSSGTPAKEIQPPWLFFISNKVYPFTSSLNIKFHQIFSQEEFATVFGETLCSHLFLVTNRVKMREA